MPKKEILYVTYNDEPLDDGVSYAIYLAGLLGEKLSVLLLSRNGNGGFEDMVVAAAFAEADCPGTAREIMKGTDRETDVASLQAYVANRCRSEGVKVTVHTGLEATVSVIRNFISQKNIDLVLLSPLVTHSHSILNKLLKTSPRPVVTMARGVG